MLGASPFIQRLFWPSLAAIHIPRPPLPLSHSLPPPHPPNPLPISLAMRLIAAGRAPRTRARLCEPARYRVWQLVGHLRGSSSLAYSAEAFSAAFSWPLRRPMASVCWILRRCLSHFAAPLPHQPTSSASDSPQPLYTCSCSRVNLHAYICWCACACACRRPHGNCERAAPLEPGCRGRQPSPGRGTFHPAIPSQTLWTAHGDLIPRPLPRSLTHSSGRYEPSA